MSPKTCSLALEEIEIDDQCSLERYEPDLKVVVNKRLNDSSSADGEMIAVTGKIYVSF